MSEKYNDCDMFGSLKDKLTETRKTFKERFEELLSSSQSLDETLDQLAESMLLADIGVSSTEKIIHAIKEKSKKNDSFQIIKDNLEEEIIKILSQFPSEIGLDRPQSVIMMVGVNGGGKTTSLAKLAFHFKQKGKSILMVAADTFRAAAQEQLVLWGKKLNIPVIKGQYGADPAAVIYDSIHSFKAHSYQLLLVDTAGRIHTNANLMNEMEKIKRVISKQIEGAPHEILLVLDATVGQNALIQAKEFLKFSGLTGIFLSKLDGTAKGGSVISIVDELKLPVKFIGIGENEKDMLYFSPQEFTKALLS
jgi:fused signal recognition particle receptor